MILLQLLVLILRNHLQDPVGQTPPPGFKYAYYEVIIPRKLTPRYGQQDLHDVNYWLQIEGKGNLVRLRQKKGIISKQFPVFTYSKQGNLQVDYPFIRDDCYYHGFVQDKPSSLAALSTCSGGLRGILRFDNKTYEILPIQPSAAFQHVVYSLEQKEDALTMRCGLTEEERRRQEAMMHRRENTASKIHFRGGWWPHIRYVKNAVVVDHDQYNYFGRNDTLVAMRIIETVHFSNSFYLPLAVNLSLVGLEIWSKSNLVDTKRDIGTVLTLFNRWKTNTLTKRIKTDASHLIAFKTLSSELGLAFVGAVCDNYWASAVEIYGTSSLFVLTFTFSHELGHVLGMAHDIKDCVCSQKKCVMAPTYAYSTVFSNCSYADYFSRIERGCLFIPPDPEKIYRERYCGNKIVEHGEQCDCGSKSECESNPCCQNNCLLRPGATCALGMCCDKCTYRPAGTLCRKEKSTCDLPEYCNGTSEWCPKDLYVQNGAPCKDDTYCYNGSCSTHYDQCQEIFGKKATVASEDCFRKVNLQGDRFGNCGLKHGTFKKCRARDILCGRIQCAKVDRLLVDEHRTVIQTPIGNKKCWGTDYHSGMNLTDTGAVKDGTPCGTYKMCISGECSSVSLLKYDCDAKKCHNHGRCNNLKHCHCDYGWAPPVCQGKGYGGSIDSGPPPISDGSNGGSDGGGGGGGGGDGGSNRGSGSSNLSLKIGISVLFISAVVLLAGLAVHYRKNLKEWLSTKFSVQKPPVEKQIVRSPESKEMNNA